MGCDIRLYVEVKIRGQWSHYGRIPLIRNYALFGKLAGVRDEHAKPIAMPRGLPDDVTEVVRFFYDYEGGHTPTWLNAEEIAEAAKWMELNMAPYRKPSILPYFDIEFEGGICFFGSSFAGFWLYPENRPKGVEDLRWVFWFDS